MRNDGICDELNELNPLLLSLDVPVDSGEGWVDDDDDDDDEATDRSDAAGETIQGYWFSAEGGGSPRGPADEDSTRIGVVIRVLRKMDDILTGPLSSDREPPTGPNSSSATRQFFVMISSMLR